MKIRFSFSLDQISSHDYEQNIQDVVNVQTSSQDYEQNIQDVVNVQTSSQDYELNTHDLLTDIVNPTDIYEKEILELDNSFNKENINPCSSKRKNLDTPKAKKSKKYEDEKMEIFRGFAAKHTSQGDYPHNIMVSNVCTAEFQTINLQGPVLDNTDSPVLDNTNCLIMNQEVLEE
ncbi:unnamed protein product [Gordionus sp. m RMFG-2023]